MEFLKKFLIFLLILSLWNFCFPRLSFSQVGKIETEVTKHPPEMRSSPEENIPVQEKTEKRRGWIWVIVGILVVGAAIGIAAAAAGGHGGGGNNNSGGNSGNVTVGW